MNHVSVYQKFGMFNLWFPNKYCKKTLLQSKDQNDVQIFWIVLGQEWWIELGQHSLIEDAAFWQFGLRSTIRYSTHQGQKQ
jgi:hypothetical protein